MPQTMAKEPVDSAISLLKEGADLHRREIEMLKLQKQQLDRMERGTDQRMDTS